MGLNEKDKQNLDRWHRNQGVTQPPADKRGAKEGHLNSLKHGIFADRCLTPEEKQVFDVIIERLHEDFQFNKSSDFLQVELVGVYSVKLVRAQMEGNSQAAESLDRMIRCHMKDLKTTKIAREGEEPKGPQSSPAEWAAELLDKVSEMAAPKEANRKKPKTSSDNTKAPKKRTSKSQGVTEGPND
jgi:hypothetical protein